MQAATLVSQERQSRLQKAESAAKFGEVKRQAHWARGPAECARCTPTHVRTRGSPARGAVSHSAPVGSSLRRPCPTGAWAVSAASAPAVLVGQCFPAAQGNRSQGLNAAAARVRPLHWTLPSVAPRLFWGWLSRELTEAPRPSRAPPPPGSAQECRATSVHRASLVHIQSHTVTPADTSVLLHCQTHSHTLTLNDTLTYMTQIHTN